MGAAPATTGTVKKLEQKFVTLTVALGSILSYLFGTLRKQERSGKNRAPKLNAQRWVWRGEMARLGTTTFSRRMLVHDTIFQSNDMIMI